MNFYVTRLLKILVMPTTPEMPAAAGTILHKQYGRHYQRNATKVVSNSTSHRFNMELDLQS